MPVGDKERFAEWWGAAHEVVALEAKRWLGSDHAVEEVMQDVALVAWSKLDTISSAAHFRHWCRTAVRWIAIDRMRRQQRRVAFLTGTFPKLGRVRPPAEPDEVIDLVDQIERLPKNQRYVLRAYLHGQSDRITAERLQVKEPSVRSLRRHAVKRLGEVLGGEE